MILIKKAAPGQDDGSFHATDRTNHNTDPRAIANPRKLSPRLARLASALLARPQTVRELIDTIPTNNVSAYVQQLRHYGLSIPCESVSFITCDGRRSWHGRYDLTAADRSKLNDELAEVWRSHVQTT